MGPWIVTADELDGRDTRVRGRVNGELRLDGNGDMIFDIPTLIETCSRGITLLAGRHDRHRHAGRRRHGFQPPSGCGAATGARRDRRHRRHREPLLRVESVTPWPAPDRARGRRGRRRGRAVVCVHGLGGSSNTWTPLMPALAGTACAHRPAGQRPVAAAEGQLSIHVTSTRALTCARGWMSSARIPRPLMGTIVVTAPGCHAAHAGASIVLFGPLIVPPDTARAAIGRAGSKAPAKVRPACTRSLRCC